MGQVSKSICITGEYITGEKHNWKTGKLENRQTLFYIKKHYSLKTCKDP